MLSKSIEEIESLRSKVKKYNPEVLKCLLQNPNLDSDLRKACIDALEESEGE